MCTSIANTESDCWKDSQPTIPVCRGGKGISFKPNPNRRHSRGVRGSNAPTTRFEAKRAGVLRDRAKREKVKLKNFALRGVKGNFKKLHGPEREQAMRKSAAHERAITTTTWSPIPVGQMSKKLRAQLREEGDLPKGRAPTLPWSRVTQRGVVRHRFHSVIESVRSFQKSGVLPAISHAEFAVLPTGKLTANEMRAHARLVRQLLVRGGVEKNPGPYVTDCVNEGLTIVGYNHRYKAKKILACRLCNCTLKRTHGSMGVHPVFKHKEEQDSGTPLLKEHRNRDELVESTSSSTDPEEVNRALEECGMLASSSSCSDEYTRPRKSVKKKTAKSPEFAPQHFPRPAAPVRVDKPEPNKAEPEKPAEPVEPEFPEHELDGIRLERKAKENVLKNVLGFAPSRCRIDGQSDTPMHAWVDAFYAKFLGYYPSVATLTTEEKTIKYDGEKRLVTDRNVMEVKRDFKCAQMTITYRQSNYSAMVPLVALALLIVCLVTGIPLTSMFPVSTYVLGTTLALMAATVLAFLWFKTTEKVRYVVYVPHIVSALVREYHPKTSIEVMRNTIRAKLNRLACFPIPDRDAIPIVIGCELAAMAVIHDDCYFGMRAACMGQP